MRTVFITGASGYIGGDILAGLVAKHPNHTYRLLVRSEQSQRQISAAYPSTIIIPGGLDDIELIRRESSNADIIIHTADAADHLPAAQAIAKGAIEGHSPDRPAYCDEDKTYGKKSEVIWDDVKDIQKIISLPDHAMHRDVDKTVFNSGASAADVLKVAIVSPTTVYGRGRGPCSQRSRQIYEMAKFILAQNKIPKIGTGEAVGSNVHVHSLTDLFVRLFEAALQRRDEDLLWGSEAYYIAEEGEHCWGEVADNIGEVALNKGFLPSTPIGIFLDRKSAFELAGFEATSWGNNMRCRASRARSILQWQPLGKTLEEELSQVVDGEYSDLKRGA